MAKGKGAASSGTKRKRLFSGMSFCVDCEEPKALETAIAGCGGAVLPKLYDGRATHVVADHRGRANYIAAANQGHQAKIVSPLWVMEVLRQDDVVATNAKSIFQPVPSGEGIPGMRNMEVCLANYSGTESKYVQRLAATAGASQTKNFKKASTTHVICTAIQGSKCTAAEKVPRVSIVTHEWLEACIAAWAVVPTDSYNLKSGAAAPRVTSPAKPPPAKVARPTPVDPAIAAAAKKAAAAAKEAEEARARAAEKARLEAAVPNNKLDHIFHDYASEEDPDLIGPDGAMKLAEDLGVSIEAPEILHLVWKCRASRQGYFTRDEWKHGMQMLRLRSKLPAELLVALQDSIKEQTKNPSSYRHSDFFDFAFSYCITEPTTKVLDHKTAAHLIRIALPGQPLVPEIAEFLENNKDPVSRDAWRGLLRFVGEVAVPDPEGLKDYDEEAAWPSLVDSFVEYLREARGGGPATQMTG